MLARSHARYYYIDRAILMLISNATKSSRLHDNSIIMEIHPYARIVPTLKMLLGILAGVWAKKDMHEPHAP